MGERSGRDDRSSTVEGASRGESREAVGTGSVGKLSGAFLPQRQLCDVSKKHSDGQNRGPRP